MYNVCPGFVYHLKITFFEERKYAPCPKFVQVQCLSRLCSRSESASQNFFVWQCLDKYWIFVSNLCPRSFSLDSDSTDSWQTLYLIGQTLYFSSWLDRPLTGFGQTLDFLSTDCPTTLKQGAPNNHGAYAQNNRGVGWSYTIFWDTNGGKWRHYQGRLR